MPYEAGDGAGSIGGSTTAGAAIGSGEVFGTGMKTSIVVPDPGLLPILKLPLSARTR